jgi:hypothetical protein
MLELISFCYFSNRLQEHLRQVWKGQFLVLDN